MRISFGLLCHNETDSLERLLDSLIVERPYEYEIVIVHDVGEEATTNILKQYEESCSLIKVFKRSLNNHYSEQKNFMTEQCSGEWVINPDADEIFPEYILENIHLIIEENDTECLWLPRINGLNGLTEQWAMNLGFRIFPDVSKAVAPTNEKVMDTESDEYKLLKKLGLIIDESPLKKSTKINRSGKMALVNVKYYLLVVNYPDPQNRIYKNDYPRIHWEKPVHERVVGYKTHSFLPFDVEMAEHVAIKHIKTLDTQVKQNQKYGKIMGQI
jgi:glycosyltransferase involved in cell wall biosynthesis